MERLYTVFTTLVNNIEGKGDMVQMEVLPELVEMSIEERSNEVFDKLCNNDLNELYTKFLLIIKSNVTNPSSEQIFELENVMILCLRRMAEGSYRRGLIDGLNILK